MSGTFYVEAATWLLPPTRARPDFFAKLTRRADCSPWDGRTTRLAGQPPSGAETAGAAPCCSFALVLPPF